MSELKPEITQVTKITEINSADGESLTTTKKAKVPALTFASPDAVLVVGLDTKDGKEHPLWDPRVFLPLDEMLIRNIRVYGVIEPIVCEKVGETTLVVDGRRRVLHAREAVKRQLMAGEEPMKIPLIWKKGDAQRMIGTKESANRFRITDGPLTSARNCQRMVDMGMSINDIANSFGVSDQTIRNWLQLLTLDADVIKAMEADELSTTSAMMFAPLTASQQRALLNEVKTKAGAKKTPVTEVKKKAAAKQGKESKGVTPSERVEKAIAVLTKAASGPDTKEGFLEALNKLSRVLAGKSFPAMGDKE